MQRKTHVLSLMLYLFLVACGANGGTPTIAPTTLALIRKPSLSISTPTDGAQFALGSEVTVQSSASDDKGVVRIELWTDGFLYRVDVSKEAEGLPSVNVTQTWPATELGDHSLQVKAINRDGGAAESPVLHISVIQGALATPTLAPKSAEPATLTPTSTPGDCTSDAVFVSDVSVPDGTVFKPGDAINKVWRVRNTGTCAWSAGYQLTFAAGAQMEANNAAVVPPTAPGATADIAVKLVAPRAPGAYTGKWKMSALNGAPFGQTLTVVIRVVDPTQPTPTRAPSTTPTLAPLVMSFTVNRTTIPYGDCATLKWDVDNALSVKLGNGGVVGHDMRLVCPTETRDYTLQAFVTEGGAPVEQQVTVEVKAYTSVGTAPIKVGYSVDLDSGTQDVTLPAADFFWDGTKTLQPKNGSTFVSVGSRGFTDVQQDECLNATNYSGANFQVSTGNLICYKTSSGRNGKLRIESADGDLKVKWVTW